METSTRTTSVRRFTTNVLGCGPEIVKKDFFLIVSDNEKDLRHSHKQSYYFSLRKFHLKGVIYLKSLTVIVTIIP